ncbi:MAG: hypothetical protein HY974_04065, partial [Candidatus Kerfeldbacteria bacterium]|nr:hypothetical protein [Candidatus Kerfeldbacteria bacterium]
MRHILVALMGGVWFFIAWGVGQAQAYPSCINFSGQVGSTCTLSATATDPEGDPIFYLYDWGDGSGNVRVPNEDGTLPASANCGGASTTGGVVPSGTTCSLDHTWTSANNFTATVHARDEAGHESTAATTLVRILPGGFDWYSPDHDFSVSATTIKWYWNAAPNAASYYVYVGGVQTATVGASSTPVSWSQVLGSYNILSGQVTVYALNQAGEGMEVAGGAKQYATLIEQPSAASFSSVQKNQFTVAAQGTLANITTGSSGIKFRVTKAADGSAVADSGWLQTNSYTPSGLSCATGYRTYLQSRNRDSVLNTETGPYTQTTSACQPPNIPTGLNSPWSSTTQIQWSWTASVVDSTHAAATSYDVYDNLNQYLCTSAAPTTNCIAPGASSSVIYSPNTQYQGKVMAFNADGTSAFSAPASAYTLPNPPTSLAASGVTDESITWSWSAPSGGAVDYVCTIDDPAVGNATVCTSPKITGNITCGLAHTFRVWARNAVSAPSVPASLVQSTSACIARAAALTGSPSTAGWRNSPTNFTYTPSCTRASNTTLTSCLTQVQRDGGAWTQISNTQTANQTYAFVSGSAYKFRTVETDSGGTLTSSLVPTTGDIQFDNDAPFSAASSPGTTQNSNFQVSVTLQDYPLSPANSSIATWDLQYKLGSSGTWTDCRTAIPAATTAITFGSGCSPAVTLSSGTYYFQTRARDNAGNVGSYAGGNGDTSTSFDGTAPAITSVTSTTSSGSYTVGAVIPLTVNFSEAVTSTGSVTVTLNTTPTARSCTFTVTNATSGSCNYTVQATDTAAVLNTTISGTIRDQAGNSLANYTPASNLAASKTILVDTTVPTTPGTPGSTTPTNNLTPTWTWTASTDPSPSSGSPTYLCTLDNTGTCTVFSGACTFAWTQTNN